MSMSQGAPDEDAQLMLRVQAGDHHAFELLFRRYTAPLVHFLARMVLDRSRAEELAQDVFIRIYQARDRYQATARFSTYAFGIASRVALNDLDRAYRRHERPLADDAAERFADVVPDADERIDAQRSVERVAAALARLAPRQRAALLLRAEEGLGYEEIGEAIGASVASVKSLLHRARSELMAELKGVRS
jgi:RNA polymerase sigma-70 factor, ECF subfamily